MSGLKPTTRDIHQILEYTPYRVDNKGQSIVAQKKEKRLSRVIGDGIYHFPRFAAIHNLLAANFGGQPVTVVENGPLSIIAMTKHMVERGDKVIVKDPDGDLAQECLVELLGPAPVDKFTRYVTNLNEINLPTPANIVYWTNPDWNQLFGERPLPYFEAERKKFATNAARYMTRDVKPGGFVVLQTGIPYIPGDCPLFQGLKFLNRNFTPLYFGIYGLHFTDYVLPTTFGATQFSIYQMEG